MQSGEEDKEKIDIYLRCRGVAVGFGFDAEPKINLYSYRCNDVAKKGEYKFERSTPYSNSQEARGAFRYLTRQCAEALEKGDENLGSILVQSLFVPGTGVNIVPLLGRILQGHSEEVVGIDGKDCEISLIREVGHRDISGEPLHILMRSENQSIERSYGNGVAEIASRLIMARALREAGESAFVKKDPILSPLYNEKLLSGYTFKEFIITDEARAQGWGVKQIAPGTFPSQVFLTPPEVGQSILAIFYPDGTAIGREHLEKCLFTALEEGVLRSTVDEPLLVMIIGGRLNKEARASILKISRAYEGLRIEDTDGRELVSRWMTSNKISHEEEGEVLELPIIRRPQLSVLDGGTQ